MRDVGPENTGMFRQIARIGLVLMLASSLKAYAEVPPYISWTEEVRLHDGNKLVLWVGQRHGGRADRGGYPITEQVVSFSVPGSSEKIVWRSSYNVQNTIPDNLKLLAVDVFGQDAYVVTTPIGRGFAKWRSPNPPYVFFKYDGKKWQRVPIEDFPPEIKEANVVIDTRQFEERLTAGKDVITADQVKAMNDELKGSIPPYWTVFTRTPLERAKRKPANTGDAED
ncbi:MAG: hypothetical protein WA435_13540 [Gallionellaceae bacterium]